MTPRTLTMEDKQPSAARSNLPATGDGKTGQTGSATPSPAMPIPEAAGQAVKRDGNSLIRRKTRWIEWLVERMILLISLSAVVTVFLIFAFVGRESLPVMFGQITNSRLQKPMTVAEIASQPPEKMAEYLGVTPAQFKGYTAETVRTLVELKGQELAQSDNPDMPLNTTSWYMMFAPHRWSGYDKPEFIWQPVSEIPKFNIIPLIIGSLKATLVALLLSVPLGVGAALYVSQLAHPKLKEWIKPAIELLSGIPSVVLGFFALIVMASALQAVFGYECRLNAFVAGVALGLTVIPVIFTISEDALTSVPRAYSQAALALGASPCKVAWQVVLPAAIPGVFAACVLGFGRAIGETMIVLMASGNASIVSGSIFESCRTITATIAAELAEVVFGGAHYRILFLLGALLFLVTFLTNLVGDLVVDRLKRRMEGGS